MKLLNGCLIHERSLMLVVLKIGLLCALNKGLVTWVRDGWRGFIKGDLRLFNTRLIDYREGLTYTDFS